MNCITSNQNPLIKEIKSLKNRKYREEKGCFFIEGLRFVEEALNEDVQIEKIILSEKLAESEDERNLITSIKSGKYQAYVLPEKLFKEVSDTENPQGIMGIIKIKKTALEDILKANGNFLVLLDSIQDPGNMGTIIRTADAAGASGIVISRGCVDLYNPKVLRSTMGSIFHVPVCYSEDLNGTIETIKLKGLKVYAAHLNGILNYFDVTTWDNIGIIIGNEANGISDEVAKSADTLIKIPMAGRAESLNASIAAGLLMYEALRYRNNNIK